jgi:hypothetical protein
MKKITSHEPSEMKRDSPLDNCLGIALEESEVICKGNRRIE